MIFVIYLDRIEHGRDLILLQIVTDKLDLELVSSSSSP